MKQKFLNFVQTDIVVLYRNDVFDKREKENSSLYSMFILLDGTCSINYKNFIYYLKPGEVHIAHSKEEFYYDFNNTNAEFLEIHFSASLLRNFDENYDLLQPFYDHKHLKILTSKGGSYEFQPGIDALLKALKTRSSRAFVLAPFLELICELNYLYEEAQPNKIKETDSNFAKIISYIDNHLYEKLLLDDISQHVFLSKKCICQTIKKNVDMTFLQLISHRRFSEAKKLIYTTNIPLQRIAKRCGFDTYSTFYRGYKKFFGISPKEELDKKMSNTN